MADNTIALIDTHCHLDMDAYAQDLDAVMARAAATGVRSVITIGIDIQSSKKALQIADRYPRVFAAVGIHPHAAEKVTEDDFRSLAGLTTHKKVVGLGEIGLDYARQYAPEDVQQYIFSRQLKLAKKLSLPVIIHDREAHEDTLLLLNKYAPYPAGGVMHCFSGDKTFAEKIIALGFFISIPGIVTFKNAASLQEVVTDLPLESMLIETDGPFLAPVPYRGKRNEPGYVIHTAEKIAELTGLDIKKIAAATTRNARSLFHLNL